MKKRPFRNLKTLLVSCLLACSTLTLSASAETSSSRLQIPDPALFLTPDTVSFTVIRVMPEDEGFKSLFDTAWKAVSGVKGAGSNFLYRAILRKIQGGESNAFHALLPAQFVRVDSLPKGSLNPTPTTATTVSGWPGLQQLWYLGQSNGDDGTPFETEDLENSTLIFRDGWKDPTRARILTNLDGTIVTFPTPEKARYTAERHAKGQTGSPTKQFNELLSSIDRNRDTYGVVVNRRGSMLKLFRWLNKSDVAVAEQAVGKEKMDSILREVQSMTWEGDLVSDNEVKLVLKFQTTSPQARKNLASMFKDVRKVLNQYGRVGRLQATGKGNDLYMNVRMLGHREMLVNYIERSF